MSKKILILLLLLMLLFPLSWYWNNLRGAYPALRPPSQNITELLNNPSPVPGENTTSFPLTIPDGFTLKIFAEGLGKARVLQQDSNGTILVSDMGRGTVMALPSTTIISGLSQPHGILLDNCNESTCTLYISEVIMLWKFDYSIKTKQATNKQQLIALPGSGRHFTRYLIKDPTNPNQLLISMGSSCDVCDEKDQRYGTIQSFNLTTKQLKPYATGLRNAVFLTTKPGTQEIWGTEMGRDHLGDNLPPDEINILTESKNYGWPICYGKNIHDTQFDKKTYIRPPCTDDLTVASRIDLPAHSAPLGLAFIPENSQWPEEYWGNLLVAYHGSWNRSELTGYKIVRIVLDEHGNKVREDDFISGWLDDSTSLGRPVDLLATEKGELYISDDKAGVVYLLEKND
jgi:glucose/arabinose dehydrogenase